MLNRLMGGAVLAYAYAVVGKYVQHRQLHESRHAHCGLEVIREYHKGGAVGAQSAVEHYTVAGRCHGKFAYAKVHICAVPLLLGVISPALELALV